MTKNEETKLEHLLTNSHKAEMIAYMESHPGDFTEVIKLAIADKQPYSWRASWLLWSCMDKNDKRVSKYLKKIIDILPKRKDNQQRELLMILQRMELNEEYEGQLFDTCTKIWEQVGKNPSLRYNAFKLMVSISKKHPGLIGEINSLTESYYTDTLSDNVKKSITKLMYDLTKTNY
ncbi:MAG: hypothetical protein IPN15_22620 [Saprospiraceae bacterium]|nr:hypothetical protein [Candidatus Vicinibacter affinis]